MPKPSKTLRYRATSKTPAKSAYYMMENASRFLWKRFDSAECKDWELESDEGIVTFSLYYDGVVDGELYEETLRDAVEEYWANRGFKFEKL